MATAMSHMTISDASNLDVSASKYTVGSFAPERNFFNFYLFSYLYVMGPLLLINVFNNLLKVVEHTRLA